jgi:two-component system, OmpR family, phosphate regulon sensor histidine kinase PhoR
MKFKPGFFDGWLMAVFVSVAIAALAVLLFYSVLSLPLDYLWPAFAIVFWASFVLIFSLLEVNVKGTAKRLRKITEKRKNKRELLKGISAAKDSVLFNPLTRIYNEVNAFAASKEEEIEELKKSEVFRREFVANVSHELKTPLFAAQGFIHTLIDGAAADEKVRTRFLSKAAKSLDGLEVLVQDLLMLSQIETGEIKMKIEPHDLVDLANEVVDQFEETAQKKKVKLKVEEPKKKAQALADGKWIRQVLTNLVSNAMQHTPEDGQVTLRFDVSKKNIEITVKDNGAGIAEEHLPRIFERFYRVDKSRSRDQGGTGLGLAIVKHILEGHGTKAEVKSEVGKGSEFSFKLERVREEE